MKRLKSAVLCVALFAAAIFAPSAVAETVGRGDFELFIDNAAFRGADGGTVEELYLRIRNSGLRFKRSGERFESRVRLAVDIRGPGGKQVAAVDEELEFQETKEDDARSPLQFHTVIKRFNLQPGSYVLSCIVEDLNAPKVSFVGIVKGRHKTAGVGDYPLSVPAFPTDAMTVSDAKFLWAIDTKGPQPEYHPNPPRLYGLYRDSLRVYVESYAPTSLAESKDLRFEMEVLDPSGQVVKRAEVPLPERGVISGEGVVTYRIVIQDDLNTLKAGNYTLYLSAGLSDQLMVRMRAGGFSVAWDFRTWEVSRSSYLTEARFLLNDKGLREFEKLSLGEQEKILHDVWKKIDPDPSTGVNEAYQKFLTRLEYVNAKYSDYATGIYSDRGLIYLKYGPPDEVEVDVVPQNRESLSDALQKVDDKFHPINYSNTGARLKFARPGQNIFVDPRRLGMVGEQGDVGYPYELWTYNGGGDPILETDRVLEPEIGLRFIFIDTEGYGRYKLESSSSMMNK